MANVLILGGGTQGLAIAKSLYKVKHRVFLIGEEHNYADDSRYVHEHLHTSLSPLSEEYLGLLLDFVQKKQIQTIIPLGDVTAEMVSMRKEILKGRVSFVAPDYDVFNLAYDKNQLMKICRKYNFPHPKTFTDVESLEEINEHELVFPLLIKPNITCGARGMTLVNSYNELKEKYPVIKAEYGDCHLQEYVRAGGAQVEVQLYISETGELVCSSVISKYRWYPEKGGSSCCAISIKNDKIVDILFRLLKQIGWVGFADFDTIEDPDTGELLIMELNPRLPACVKTAIVSGINWGEVIVDSNLGLSQKEYTYKSGEVLRHLGFDTLWFFHSKNRWRMHPSYFHFFGKHIHYQDFSDWSDPVPFFRGTFRNIMKLINHTAKNKVER
jgi:predicted ATP-grasp superfamily ATP-dependent carboligase